MRSTRISPGFFSIAKLSKWHHWAGTETDKLIKGECQGMLSCHEIFELLNDPNIWIADTGASVDTTPYLDKLESVVKFEDGRGAKNADGGTAGIKEEGDAPGLLCDKFGVPQMEV
ncbi:unnamed protein product [Cylindrotheca closterium]|uniref:Uncharacterized protein n=1 Tax=Cylindrotheca closterium TaxID=2856 RepID=A0AAD2CWJ7_9STRA|nr:unnamed protein product [Cylindrotheca closterium]